MTRRSILLACKILFSVLWIRTGVVATPDGRGAALHWPLDGVWIMEVGDVELPVDSTRVVLPIRVTTSGAVAGLAFCLDIDVSRFRLVRDQQAALEGTAGHMQPEFFGMTGKGGCGYPAAGFYYDFHPPREPEKDLGAGFDQLVLNFILEPIGVMAPGETFEARLLTDLSGGSAFTSPAGTTIYPDATIPGRIRFGSTGIPPVEALHADVVSGAEEGVDVALDWRNVGSYDAIRVERNGQTVATLAGGESSLVDSQAPHGVLNYKVIAVTNDVTSMPTTISFSSTLPPGAFLRGDTSRDGLHNIGDPIATLTFLFLGGQDLPCEDAADANDDGSVGIADAIATLQYLFLGTKELSAPGTIRPWFDPTADDLSCAR